MCVWVCENKDVCILNPTQALATHWPGSHHWTPTPVPLTCCWMFPLDSPSVGIHHFTSTGSVCGPENRPNPLGPRSHQVTHIVRFDTHPAQKSNIWTCQSSKKVLPFTVATQLNSEYQLQNIFDITMMGKSIFVFFCIFVLLFCQPRCLPPLSLWWTFSLRTLDTWYLPFLPTAFKISWASNKSCQT